MRISVQNAWIYFAPQGPSARTFIGTYMAFVGLARVWTGNTPAGGVNIFSARVYGLLLIICGLALFFTVPSKFRYHWIGRIAAIAAAVLWLLIIAQALPARAWVSTSGALVFVIALVNEIRVAGQPGSMNGIY
jgi:vacuolar-type H+-ATPase subunit I/STV1